MADTPKNKEVGRGRPPVHSRFAKGKSGNPKGRPPKSRDLKKLAEAELDQCVTITENGRRVRITKREFLVKKLVNDAVKGEDKQLQVLLKIIGTAPEPEPVAMVDAADLALFAMRYLPQGTTAPTGGAGREAEHDEGSEA